MNTRDFLRQYKTISIRIEAKREQIKRLREIAEYVSPDGSGVHVTSTRDKIGDASTRIADLENEIKADIKALVEKQNEIIHAINTVKDDKQRTVLELHYINGWNFYKIARKINYSVDWVYTLHGRGLENLKKENK